VSETRGFTDGKIFVMPALGAGIHAFARIQAKDAHDEKEKSKAWMPAPSAGMTT
jgi:hypothetical protein